MRRLNAVVMPAEVGAQKALGRQSQSAFLSALTSDPGLSPPVVSLVKRGSSAVSEPHGSLPPLVYLPWDSGVRAAFHLHFFFLLGRLMLSVNHR